VEFAEEFTHERPQRTAAVHPAVTDVADNSVEAFERVIVLILDDLHFQGKTDEVKRMGRRIVEQLAPGASMAMVTTSGAFGIEPTVDRAHLLRELERFVDKFDPEGKRLANGRLFSPTALGSGPGDLARFFGDMTQYRTLQDVARMLGSADSRRKVFVWISGGNAGAAAEPVARQTTSNDDAYLSALAGLLEALRRSNVTTYSIATGDFSPRLLRKVSETTGGLSISSQDFDREVGRIAEDLDHYYLLGFYPLDRKGRGFREIDVSVDRPGVVVRHRRGYFPGDPPRPPSNKTALAQLAGGVLPKTELPLRILAVPNPQRNSKPGLSIALEVRSARHALSEPDGMMRDTLRYEIWAVDLQKKKPIKSAAREVRVALNANNESSPVVAYQVQIGLEVPAGRYQIRASAISAKEKKGGSVYLQADVPLYIRSETSLGPIILAYEDEGRRAACPSQTLPVFATVPTHDREFGRDDVLRVSFEARALSPGASSRIELLAANGQRVLEDSRMITEDFVSFPLSLRALHQGSYRMRVSLPGASGTLDRIVDFAVR
jgi:VWFA-related protein